MRARHTHWRWGGDQNRRRRRRQTTAGDDPRSRDDKVGSEAAPLPHPAKGEGSATRTTPPFQTVHDASSPTARDPGPSLTARRGRDGAWAHGPPVETNFRTPKSHFGIVWRRRGTCRKQRRMKDPCYELMPCYVAGTRGAPQTKGQPAGPKRFTSEGKVKVPGAVLQLTTGCPRVPQRMHP